MTFLYPGFLFALSAIAIPIIIHLFNFRRYRRVYFSNVRFLKEVQQETKNRAKLRQWLILLCRCLAVAAIVLAFARPVIPGKSAVTGKAGDKYIGIYMDNSFSMDAAERGGRLLDISRNFANDIADVAGNTDKLQLLTNDFEGRHAYFYPREEIVPLIDEIQTSPVTRPMSEALIRLTDQIKREGDVNARIYVISDFQKTTADFENFPADTSVSIRLVPVSPSSAENIFIDTLWFASPEYQANEPMNLSVKIKNLSGENFENIPLILEVDGVQKAPVTFSVSANSETTVEVNFSVQNTGFHNCRIYLRDRQIVFDDNFLFSFYVPDQVRVMEITGSNAGNYLEKIFRDDPFFKYTRTSEGQVDYSVLTIQNFVLLNEIREISSGLAQELKKFLDGGGSLMIFPAAGTDQVAYNNFLSQAGVNTFSGIDTTDTRVDGINAGNPYYADVFEMIPSNIDLPQVRQQFIISNATRRLADILMQTRNGRKFFSREQAGDGLVYLWSVPLQESWSNLPRHAIFVPSVLKAALTATGRQPLYYTIGSGEKIIVRNLKRTTEKPLVIVDQKGVEFIPEQRPVSNGLQLGIPPDIKKDGIYRIMQEKDTVGYAALNFSRRESPPQCFTVEEIQQQLVDKALVNYSLLNNDRETFRKAVIESDDGIKLWKLFIILALFFLAAETALIRLLPG